MRQQALQKQNLKSDPRAKLKDIIGQIKSETKTSVINTVKPAENKISSPAINIINKTLKTANDMLLYDQNFNNSNESLVTKNLACGGQMPALRGHYVFIW